MMGETSGEREMFKFGCAKQSHLVVMVGRKEAKVNVSKVYIKDFIFRHFCFGVCNDTMYMTCSWTYSMVKFRS